MLDGITLDAALSISNGKRFTLDLGGFALTNANATTVVIDDANTDLTITNGTIRSAANPAFNQKAGTVTVASSASLTGRGTGNEFYFVGGTLNNYGRIELDHEGQDVSYTIKVLDGGVFNGYAGSFVNGGGSVFKAYAQGQDQACNINIYGGTYELFSAKTSGGTYNVFYVTKDGANTITIHDGLFYCVNDDHGIFYFTKPATTKLCTADGTVGLDDQCLAKFNHVDHNVAGTPTFKDLCKPGYGPVKDADDDYYMVKKVWDVVFVNGDVATTNVVADGATTTAPAEDPVKEGYIFKGWFNGDVAFDATVPVTADVTYTAKFEKAAFAIILADVTKGYASTLEGAIAAAADGDTIMLLDDYTPANTEKVIFMKSATLDLNGKTLTFTDAQRDGKKLAMGEEEGDAPDYVTFTNGTIRMIAGGCGRGLNVFGGTANIYCTITQTSEGGAAQQPIFDSYAGATINIYPSAVITAPHGDIFRSKGDQPGGVGDCNVNIYGGTLTCENYGFFVLNKSYVNFATTIADGVINFAKTRFAFYPGAGQTTGLTCSLDDSCKAKFDAVGDLANFIAPGYALVKGDDDYYTIQQVFDITITDPENGTLETSVTNGVVAGTVVTVTATPATGFELESITVDGVALEKDVFTFTMLEKDMTVAATFKSAAPAWPGDWPGDADPAVVDKFADWQKANPGVTSFEGHEEQFLMNVAADAQVPELKIESITVEGDTATIVVGAQGVDLEKGINGKLFVDGTDELGAEWASTVIDATAESFTEGKATFTVPNAKFMKARVDFSVPELPAE